MGKFDEILSEINDFGRYQRVRYLLICLAGILPPITTYINSFVVPFPQFKCNNIALSDDDDATTNSSFRTDATCSYTSNGTTHKCTSWQYDHTFYESTLTEEWNLVCDRAFLRSHIQSVYFTGYLVGSALFGALSDR
jgi:OCT family organic cation transporter-like MFS transporter 4/5